MGGGNKHVLNPHTQYGTADVIDIEKAHSRHSSWMNALMVFMCWFIPCSIFTLLYALLSLPSHQHDPALHWVFAVLCLLLISVGGFVELSAVLSFNTKASFLFFSSLLAYVLAIVLGNANWNNNMQYWVQYSTMSVAVDVDPGTMLGQEVMDAGRVLFTPNVHLALQWSASLRQNWEYCVVPVVSSENNAVPANAYHSYDFWAVGVNCCNNVHRSFACNKHNGDRRAVGGMRLINKYQESLYRLAVKNAEALHNISAANPVFVHVVQDPFQTVRTNWYRGTLWTGLGIIGYVIGQTFLIAALLPKV